MIAQARRLRCFTLVWLITQVLSRPRLVIFQCFLLFTVLRVQINTDHLRVFLVHVIDV